MLRQIQTNLTAYHDLVDAMLDRVHRHVRLVYPFAPTERTVVSTFGFARTIVRPLEAPCDAAWLFGLTQRAVLADSTGAANFERLNAIAVVQSVRDVAENLNGNARFEAMRLVDAVSLLTPYDQHLLRLQTIEQFSVTDLAWVIGRGVRRAATDLSTARTRLSCALADMQLGPSGEHRRHG